MNSRDLILKKISEYTVPFPEETLPELMPLQPAENPSVEAMLQTFATALEGIAGKFYHVESLADVQNTLTKMVSENGWERFSCSHHPQLMAVLPRDFFHGEGKNKVYLGEPEGETDKGLLATLPMSIVFPRFLIAETGTCVVLNRTAHERLNCYLTPTCVMIAPVSALRENLQMAWESVETTTEESLTDMRTRGEFVLVTGPSRTADIERVSVLGVHGPKTLIVIVYDD